MGQKVRRREKMVNECSKKNRWYLYERFKNYLSPQDREAEAKKLTKDLEI